jgi:GAF domain-containing protein/HAMP domain-containing protein
MQQVERAKPDNAALTTGELRLIRVRERVRVFELLTLIGMILGTLSASLYSLLYYQTREWQLLASAMLVVLAALFLFVARQLAPRRSLEFAGYWFLLAIFLAFGASSLIMSGMAWYNAISGALLIVVIATTISPKRPRVWLASAIVLVACVLLVDRFAPLDRYDTAESAILRLHALLATGALVILAAWQVMRLFRLGTIRTRLLIAFLAMALVPIAILSVGVVLGGFQAVQESAIDRIESVATLQESEMDTWLKAIQSDLALSSSGELLAPHIEAMKQASTHSEEYWAARTKLTAYLFKVVRQTGRFHELSILNPDGRVVASTKPATVGELRRNQMHFKEGLEGPNIQPAYYSVTTQRPYIYTSRPLVDEHGQLIGVLAGSANIYRLNDMLHERTGMGETGEAYLVGANSTRMTGYDPRDLGIYATSHGIVQGIENQGRGSGLYDNYQGIEVVGAYRWIPDMGAVLMAEQAQSETFGTIYAMLFIVVAGTLLAITLAIVAALAITRSISDPLSRLANTATEISQGDLGRIAQVERDDEVGTLARAFNSMTAQLRSMISGLETRVAERTQEIQQRSRYLEASAEVGRATASILDMDELIQQVVELIREQFDLYYVGLFLVDQKAEWVELKAATGQAGLTMLARGHCIQVGEGMVGWSVAHGEPRVAEEAGADAVRLATPELPDTRSEAALPLRSRGQVLGALSVQHTKSEAFDQDTITVLQTMADQVAVTLANARLFAESQEALEATQRAYGDLSSQAWAELLQAQPNLGFRSVAYGVSASSEHWQPEMEQAMITGQTVRSAESDGDRKQRVAVPIKVRGQVIGVLETYKPAESGGWSKEEIALLETIADQLDPALEGARLYQETQRRAAREQAIRHVTEEMRRTVDVETILQDTVARLAQAMGAPRAYVRLGTETELVHHSGTTPDTDSQPPSPDAESIEPGPEESQPDPMLSKTIGSST